MKSATFPFAVAAHPVRVEATVTESYINGLGGDPRVDYQYRVAGHTYNGSGGGKLGGEQLVGMRAGDRVAIEYAAAAPSESCTCDAAHERPLSPVAAILLAALLSLPLAMLSGRTVKRWRASRPLWFHPVHGFREWAAFLGGILVAVVAVSIFLDYLLGPSVGGG